jgi:hypothetical protein
VYIGVSGLVSHGSACGQISSGSAVEAVRSNDGSLLWSTQIS